MSQTITNAFINQFKANIFFGAQQKGSRLRNFVRNESQNGVLAFYDGLSPTNANELVSRHADTQYVVQTHLRRAVNTRDWTWADLIDNADKLRLLNDPTSAYSMNAMMSLGRTLDDLIIAAALGTAKTGVAGATDVVLPASQWVGATDGTVKTNLNVLTLRRIKSKFGVNDVDDSEQLHIAVTQSQIDSLLADDQVTSHDYNNVKALVQGDVDTFMGFKFHRLQRLPTSGSGGFLAEVAEADGSVTLVTGDANNMRRCFAWAPSGIVLAMGQEMEAKIDIMPNKNYSTQVFARMSAGAARLEEEKVVGIICNES